MIGTATADFAINTQGNTAARNFIETPAFITRAVNSFSSMANDYIVASPKPSVIAAELLSYLQLEKGWDGYDAITPNSHIVYSCYELLNEIEISDIKIKTMPKLMLSSSGEIGLYWKFDDLYIEISIDSPNFYSYLIEDKLENHIIGIDDVYISEGIPEVISNKLLARQS
jgi:hypothetical protein